MPGVNSYILKIISGHLATIVPIIVVFIVGVFLAVNAKNMTQNWIISLFLKAGKTIDELDIVVYKNKRYLITKIGSYRVFMAEIEETINGSITVKRCITSVPNADFTREITKLGSFLK